jgi:outer membrane protein OmpA-like peptidoglycan-associated protein
MKPNFFIGILFILCQTVLSIAQTPGLVGEYYDGTNFNRKVMTRTDSKIDFEWDNTAPAKGMNSAEFSVRWKGQIKAPKTGQYEFSVLVDDGVRVRVNGQSVISAWGLNDNKQLRGKITLTAGQLYDLEVEYFNGMFEGEIHLYWQMPGDEPVLGGLMGFNDKVVSSEYYFQPKPPAPVVQNPPAKPVPPAKTTPKPTPKKDTPAPKKKTNTTPPPKDSIEQYKPKNIQFEQSKSVLLKDSEAELDRLAAFLLRHPDLKITIEGHTDQVGKPEQNLKLSQNRANRVSNYLIQKGVTANRITAIGYGDTRPLIKSGTGVEKNRRVAFLIE